VKSSSLNLKARVELAHKKFNRSRIPFMLQRWVESFDPALLSSRVRYNYYKGDKEIRLVQVLARS
jgi:hypothetical protein